MKKSLYLNLALPGSVFRYVTNGMTNPIYPPSFFDGGYNKINPTKAGEILIRLNEDEVQAEKFSKAINEKISSNIAVRTATNNQIIDIQDMDEAIDETDILNGLQESTKCDKPKVFKILNIRAAYERIKQVQIKYRNIRIE